MFLKWFDLIDLLIFNYLSLLVFLRIIVKVIEFKYLGFKLLWLWNGVSFWMVVLRKFIVMNLFFFLISFLFIFWVCE